MSHPPATANGYSRLFRYVPAGALPGRDILAVFDPKMNFVLINKDEFDKLDDFGRRRVWNTQRTLLVN
jgi:hypothetical protein